jgi:spermidine synthase
MLLHPNPRRVFVLGLGTGMTLGSTSVHPEVEELTLAEIERGVIGAARTFGEFNHFVLDDPRLRIVFNDGRNYLATTRRQFDVITADPIHPWSGGAAYLYTDEYFRIVASRLAPGGIACQWLPIYELSVHDLQTVVRTFGQVFRHMMIWVTDYDAELVGSNSPFMIDEAALERRIAHPLVKRDLEAVEMGAARDFLSYFTMGTAAARGYGAGGAVNTDDNLLLEFSAPLSMGVSRLTGDNVEELTRRRESILPYLAPAASAEEAASRAEAWREIQRAARIYDRVHVLSLRRHHTSPEFADLLAAVERERPDYAPARFLRRIQLAEIARTPRLVETARFAVLTRAGAQAVVEISAVAQAIGDERAVVSFVDNAARVIYGERYFDGPPAETERDIRRLSHDVLEALRATHRAQAASEGRPPGTPPDREATLRRFQEAIGARTTAGEPRP